MNIMILSPLLSLLAGIAILIWPRLLNYIKTVGCASGRIFAEQGAGA